MTNTLKNYFFWASVQHIGVIVTVWFFPIEVQQKVLYSILLFTLCHVPNVILIPITLAGGSLIYISLGYLFNSVGWYCFLTLPIFTFIHAFVGRILVQSGIEMRVLWLHPLWSKK